MTSRPHHILLTTDALGGVWQYTQTLGAGLARKGWRVTAVCLGPLPSREIRTAWSALGIDLRALDQPLDWLATMPTEIHEAGRSIAHLADELGATSIHLHAPSYAAGSAFPVPVVAVSHSCLGTWWQSVRHGPIPDDFIWRIQLHRQGLLRADRTICPSAAFAQTTADYYDVASPAAVYNGSRPPDVPRRKSAPVFGFTAGRLWDEAKNVACLDEAAAETSLPITVAGSTTGPQGQHIHLAHVRQLGPLGHAQLTELLVTQQPIYVAPALYEPFGLGILEAAQAGCPLILGDIPTLRDMWSDAALFVPPHDRAALADAMTMLQGDEAQRASLAEAARAHASTFDDVRFVQATATIHADLVRQPSKEPMPA